MASNEQIYSVLLEVKQEQGSIASSLKACQENCLNKSTRIDKRIQVLEGYKTHQDQKDYGWGFLVVGLGKMLGAAALLLGMIRAARYMGWL